VDQFVIHDSTGREHFYRLYPNMRPEKVKQEILAMVTLPIKGVWLHCDKRLWDEFTKLFQAMFPTAQQHPLEETPVGERMVDGRIELTVNSHYWQALAKIGFHYYLCHTRRGVRGDEQGFAGIRDFIINGGDREQFFRKPKNLFALPFGELPQGGVMTPTQWCHILGADETSGEVAAYVQMFVGPGCIPEPHYIVLGKLDSEIVGLTSFIQGHVYLYDEKQNSSGKAGVVEAATVTMYPKDRVPASVFVR
jgi:hypothetical protein